MSAAAGPVIETARLTLRPWEGRDRADFAAISADPEVMRHFPGTLDQVASDTVFDRIAARWGSEGICFGAVERREDRAFLGIAGIAHVGFDAPVSGLVEIGWRLGRAHWGRGYASEAARAWLEHGFRIMALPRIIAFTTARNLRSQAVMARIGMTRAAWLDFDHPHLPAESPLRRHLVWEITAAEWARSRNPGRDQGTMSSSGS